MYERILSYPSLQKISKVIEFVECILKKIKAFSLQKCF